MIRHVKKPFYMLAQNGAIQYTNGCDNEQSSCCLGGVNDAGIPVVGYCAPMPAYALGDPSFTHDHGIEYAYCAGGMANGIASTDLVVTMSEHGMLGFFGAAGLDPDRIERAIDELQERLGDKPFGCNLIHNPHEPSMEMAVADLYIRKGIKVVEAAAYMKLTLPVVKYRVHGIHRDAEGNIVAPNSLMAKVSRVEVASRFFAPPPANLLRKLVESGDITAEQAEMAAFIPMAQDVTAEADSGGHTDGRPAITLLPTMVSLRDRFQDENHYPHRLRIGLGGGVSTPASAAAAFSMGASYIVTGSINQACSESGTCDEVRRMLSEARQADVAMAPSADMFEIGAEVQVLKRGTMFAIRAKKLYELYRSCTGINDIPTDEREKLEKNVFRAPLEEIWEQTRASWLGRDESKVKHAEKDPKVKMALIFRSYLGLASRWANIGEPDRKIDYQIWCGPAMGAFNEWTTDSFLAAPENRKAATVAVNILYGAAVYIRCNTLRSQGYPVPPDAWHIKPMELDKLEEYLR
jgi:PfaD family protein